jgi:hypothetical protein
MVAKTTLTGVISLVEILQILGSNPALVAWSSGTVSELKHMRSNPARMLGGSFQFKKTWIQFYKP